MASVQIGVFEKQDIVHDIPLQCVQMTFDFAGEHARSIIRDTNFIEQLLPRVREIVDDLYDQFLFRHTILSNSSDNTNNATEQEQIRRNKEEDISIRLGPMKRVVHEHHYSDKQCTICQQSFVQNEFLRILPTCKHVFHKRCIDLWIFKPPHTCPTCREAV